MGNCAVTKEWEFAVPIRGREVRGNVVPLDPGRPLHEQGLDEVQACLHELPVRIQFEQPVIDDWAVFNDKLVRSRPDVLIDGLSLYNPALSMDRYQELRAWLGGYREVARTKGSIVYLATIGR